MHAQRRYTLTASCPDRVGIVARVATFIAENQGWILETSHHADEDTQRYFMRIEMKADSLPFDLAEFRRRFQPIAAEFRMDWRIADSAVRKRLVLLVSKQEHCLYDLLARWQSKELEVDIPCVISNHETFRGFVEWHGIPFHHVPVTAENKAVASAEIARLFEDAHGDVRLRVLMGSAYGRVTPVRTLSPLFYAEARVPAGARLAVPDEHEERAAYVVSGALRCCGGRVPKGRMLVFTPGRAIALEAEEDAHVMLLGGAPLDGPRYVWWNFVSSSKARIERAKQDWREGRFPKVPGDAEEFIPLPDR